jgi:S-(hydroxymethyl)glutathione dehydrogenase/alcohol dehydrogenase
MEIELDEPWQDELLVRMVASGLCHSDDHMATGDQHVPMLPLAGGHEGAGVVERVGPNTLGFEVGDHVVFSFLPACGRCRWCATGRQNLCSSGATIMTGGRVGHPGEYRMATPDGRTVGQLCGLASFCERTVVSTYSAVKVPKDISLVTLSLLGCSVGTGWGAAVNSAQGRPGDTVSVMGVGGIGIHAVQGAAMAGASQVIAVDPVALKRDTALGLGATAAFEDISEAVAYAHPLTDGQGADSAIVTIGVVNGEHIAQAFRAIRKGGIVVVTGLGQFSEVGIPVSLAELTLYQKRIQGSLYGQCNPTSDIPMQLQMYREGKLKLDELITNTYTLDEVATGYDDLRAGKNIRGVLVFD